MCSSRHISAHWPKVPNKHSRWIEWEFAFWKEVPSLCAHICWTFKKALKIAPEIVRPLGPLGLSGIFRTHPENTKKCQAIYFMLWYFRITWTLQKIETAKHFETPRDSDELIFARKGAANPKCHAIFRSAPLINLVQLQYPDSSFAAP